MVIADASTFLFKEDLQSSSTKRASMALRDATAWIARTRAARGGNLPCRRLRTDVRERGLK